MKSKFRNVCNTIIFILIFSSIITPIFPAQQSEHSAKIKPIKLAAFQASQRAIERLKGKIIEGIVDDCKSQILDKSTVNQHISRTQSENKLHSYVRERLRGELENDLEKIHQSLFRTYENLFSQENFINEIEKKFNASTAKSINYNINNNFQNIFRQAREGAINDQVKELSEKVYPKNEEIRDFEDAYLGGWKDIDRNRIMKILKGRIGRDSNILEEVDGLKEKIIVEVLGDIQSQMERQEGAVSFPIPEGRVTYDTIRGGMTNNVSKVISQDQENERSIVYKRDFKGSTIEISKQIERTVYDVFIFIRAKIEKEARIKEEARFQTFCQNATFSVWDRQDLYTTIRGDLRAHKNYETSKNRIITTLLSEAESNIKRQYVAMAPQAERNRFGSILDGYLARREFQNVIKVRFGELIDDDLEEVRNQIAGEQLRENFIGLFNKTWEVPKLSRDEHRDRSDIMKRAMGKSSDPLNVSNPDDCFQNPIKGEIYSGYLRRGDLLDNTERMVFDRVNELIMGEAKRAWDGQMMIYLNHTDYIEDKANKRKINIKDEVRNSISRMTREELVEYFKERIKRIWVANRMMLIWEEKVSDYRQRKYIPLFDYIEEKIEQQLNTDIGRIIKESTRPVEPIQTQPADSRAPSAPTTTPGGGRSTDPKDTGSEGVSPGGGKDSIVGLDFMEGNWEYFQPEIEKEFKWILFFVLLLILIVIILIMSYIGIKQKSPSVLYIMMLVFIIFIIAVFANKDKLVKINTKYIKESARLVFLEKDGEWYVYRTENNRFKFFIVPRDDKMPLKVELRELKDQ